MPHRSSVPQRALSLVSIAALAALLACSGDQAPSPVTPELESPRAAVTPHPMNANPPSASPSDRALAPAAMIITNGTVMLGVHDFGNLNIGGGTPSNGTGSTTVVGLRYVPTNSEGTSPGCLCEGWGVADAGTGEFGNASFATGGFDNVVLNSFTSTASTANSVVTAFGRLRVTHDFQPSPVTPFLYEIDITIENISATAVSDLRYTRGMDFDEAPNTFSEFVTIQGTAGASNVIFASDDGFQDVNPLAGFRGGIIAVGDQVDTGPSDHGAHFDFSFGMLAPGATREFTLFYGAAGTEADALNALGLVGAEIFAFGQANCSSCLTWVPAPNVGHTTGTEGAMTGRPHTHIFAFQGVGGTPIGEPPPPAGDCPAPTGGSPVGGREFLGVVVFVGTSGDDIAVGDPGKRNVFIMREGNDSAVGGALEDAFFGGDGDDTWCGNAGRDGAFGNQGSDRLDGSAGVDRNDGGHTPVPSSEVDQDTDSCSAGDLNFLCEVEIASISSARFKSDVAYLAPDTWSIAGLRPAAFRYRAPYGNPASLRLGLVAEDLARTYPEAVVFDARGAAEAIRYGEIHRRLLSDLGQGSIAALKTGVDRLAGVAVVD
jgi:hypothetical protein